MNCVQLMFRVAFVETANHCRIIRLGKLNLCCFLSLTALLGKVQILTVLPTRLLLTFGLCALSFQQWNPVINTRYCTIAKLLSSNLGLLLLVKQYFSPLSASKSSTRATFNNQTEQMN